MLSHAQVVRSDAFTVGSLRSEPSVLVPHCASTSECRKTPRYPSAVVSLAADFSMKNVRQCTNPFLTPAQRKQQNTADRMRERGQLALRSTLCFSPFSGPCVVSGVFTHSQRVWFPAVCSRIKLTTTSELWTMTTNPRLHRLLQLSAFGLRRICRLSVKSLQGLCF